MKAKTVTAELDFVVVKREYHSVTIDLDIPTDYNMKEFDLVDFEDDIKDMVEDSYWSGTSTCHDQETDEITVIWD